MKRTVLLLSIFLLATSMLASVHLAEAQKAGKVYRIGFLDLRLRSTTTDPRFIALRQGLRELGYVEGQNLVLEYRSAKGKRKRSPESRRSRPLTRACRHRRPRRD